MRNALALLMLLAAQCMTLEARSEFIANAFGGESENATRAAAARAFQGYQNFYSGMAALEQRNVDQAQGRFREAASLFQQGQAGYQSAAGLLTGRPFNLARLEPQQQQLVLQYLGPCGANPGSDQAAILRAFAASFEHIRALIGGDPRLSLARFREIQVLVARQIFVGTMISQVMQN